MPAPAPPPGSDAPQPGPTPGAPAGPEPDALDEVRARLAELDDRPLQEHPEQFAAIDRLLRLALDETGRAEPGQAVPDRAGSR